MVKTDPRWIEAGPRPMLIGGKWRTGEGGKTFKVISPFTNEPLTTISAFSQVMQAHADRLPARTSRTSPRSVRPPQPQSG